MATQLSQALTAYTEAERVYRAERDDLQRHAKLYADKKPKGSQLELILTQCGAVQDKEVTAQILEDAIKRDIHDVGALLKHPGKAEPLGTGAIDMGGAEHNFFRIAGQRYYVPARVPVSAVTDMHAPAEQMKAFLDGRAEEKELAAAWRALAQEASIASAPSTPTPGPGGT